MEQTLEYQKISKSIRQMPGNFIVAHQKYGGGWVSEPDLAADLTLCTKVYRTINWSWGNKYRATGEQIIEMAMKLK